MSEKTCKSQYSSENIEIVDTMFCAAAKGKDSCQVNIYYLEMYYKNASSLFLKYYKSPKIKRDNPICINIL